MSGARHGRPSKLEEPRFLGVAIEKKDYAALAERAKREGITCSEATRRAVREWLA